jgi:hypothetical protein
MWEGACRGDGVAGAVSKRAGVERTGVSETERERAGCLRARSLDAGLGAGKWLRRAAARSERLRRGAGRCG